MEIYFLTINFTHLDFIELFGLNSSLNSLFEILSIRDFSYDFLFDSLM